MDRIAEGIKNRGDIMVNIVGVNPNIGHGQGQIFGKSAGSVDADTFGVLAQMAAASQAVAAVSANDMTLATHELARKEIFHIRAYLDNLPDEFMADRHGDGDGLAGPLVPFVDVEVGAAYASAFDTDENVVNADFRLRDVFEPQARFGVSFD